MVKWLKAMISPEKPPLEEAVFDPEDNWRNVGVPFRERQRTLAWHGLTNTLNEGMRVHGPRFAGDPAAHARGEIYDLIFYVGVMEQRIEMQEARIAELEGLLRAQNEGGVE